MERIALEEAGLLLRSVLATRFIHGIALGDGWTFSFDSGVKLFAQDVTCDHENAWNGALARSPFAVLDGIDPEQIAKAIQVVRLMRRVVRDVTVGLDGAAQLVFDGGEEVVLTTSTGLVDWQWALSQSDVPYVEDAIGCYSREQVYVDTAHPLFRDLPGPKLDSGPEE